jgi:transposase
VANLPLANTRSKSTTYGEKSLHARERDTTCVVAQRQHFVETVTQHYDTRRLYFLDETGLRLDACCWYVRTKGGQYVRQAVPLKRGPLLTLIGTVSAQGLGAIQLFEGALNYERFALYVSRCLAPALRLEEVLVLDNLAVHKLGGLREWLAKRGVQVLFPPPYSPDFSPLSRPRASPKRPCAAPKPKVERHWKQPCKRLSTELAAKRCLALV